MKVEQYHSKTLLNFKDENLWNSHWCLIRTHHNYPLQKYIFLHIYQKLPIGPYEHKKSGIIFSSSSSSLRSVNGSSVDKWVLSFFSKVEIISCVIFEFVNWKRRRWSCGLTRTMGRSVSNVKLLPNRRWKTLLVVFSIKDQLDKSYPSFSKKVIILSYKIDHIYRAYVWLVHLVKRLHFTNS